EVERLGLTNVRTFCDDAVDILEHCIPAESLHRVQLYFPDPWHKKKHHKRRIVQAAFIGLVHSKVQPAGILHMATDWEDYAEHMLTVMESVQGRSEEHTSELQSRFDLVCRLLLEKKKCHSSE